MGTRSITTVRSKWGENSKYNIITNIYRHWDGYPSVQGADLFEFLNGLQVVNGIRSEMPERYANGPNRLAAMLVCFMESKNADPSIMSGDEVGQEFHYVISVDYGYEGGVTSIDVYDGPITFFGDGGDSCVNPIFSGSIKDFGEFLKTQD